MRKHGFTLIELLIVVVITGILVVVGYPSYQSYLRGTRRQDAIQSMLSMQLVIESYIAQNNALPPTTGAFAANQDSAKRYYQLTYSLLDTTLLTYKIVATVPTGGDQANDKTPIDCTTLTLTSNKDGITPYSCK